MNLITAVLVCFLYLAVVVSSSKVNNVNSKRGVVSRIRLARQSAKEYGDTLLKREAVLAVAGRPCPTFGCDED
ncbi:hypothetical protein BDB01DRAFT_791552 [Pilobolus umbonatus]|nr:hypothetical protein BDB01DRAFT_791552 [Pilobolus umbonatus]